MRVETGRSVRRLSQQSGEKWWLRLSGGSEHVIVGSCEFYIYLKVETTRKREVQDDSKIWVRRIQLTFIKKTEKWRGRKRWRVQFYTCWVWVDQLRNEQRKVSRVELSSLIAVRSKEDEDAPVKNLRRNHHGDCMRCVASFAYLYFLINNYALFL